VHPSSFEVTALFGALRGMLRPLLVNQSLALVFEEPEGVPPLYSDESKVSQILRNFISNALKYTEHGEVRVSVALTEDRNDVQFRVADTGIGIPDRDLARIFDEFVQIENPLQKRVKGTGLGLPLSKRLAELLNGRIAVESALGIGSTFSLTIPLVYRGATLPEIPAADPNRVPILLVEDADEDALLVERALAATRYQPFRARTAEAADSLMAAVKPAAILLDIRLYGDDVWDFLARLKRDPSTAHRPVVIVSTIGDEQKGFALGADAYCVKPVDRGSLLSTLDRLVGGVRAPLRVLTIDDEEASRYIIRQLLHGTEYELIEASTGSEGLRKARRESPPDVILLDLRLTDTTGFDVLDRLRADPATAAIPVLVVTSQRLSEDDRNRLTPAATLLSKTSLTRAALQAAVARAVGARPAVQKAS
jgi:CheY-like chemotaxis protein